MKPRTVFAVCTLLGVMWTGVATAQEPSEPPADPPTEKSEEAPEAPADTAPAAEPEAAEVPEGKKKIPLGLYVYAGGGAGDVEDFNTSIVTTSSHNSENLISLDGVDYARFIVGWRLANNKGDFAASFNGFSETGYEYSGIGRQAALPPGQGAGAVLQPLDWWTVTIQDGVLESQRAPPNWTLNDDANGNTSVDRDEVRYPTIDRQATIPVTDNLLNRFQNWDLVYGRTWGPRGFQGRWAAGLRYYEYEGNMLASAWLGVSDPGEGYTDGSLLRTLNFSQNASGLGPTALLEGRWNILEQRLQFYINGQIAFLLADIESDTGVFYTEVRTTTVPLVIVPLQAHLQETRSKSVWNTNAEAGMRVLLKSGLSFDLAYQIQGYLDSVLTPERMQIPESVAQSQLGVSAVYNTQDIVVTAWRVGVGFQF